ncbi:hypothetical protein ACFQ3Z_37100 [Streptomyces nogalater]
MADALVLPAHHRPDDALGGEAGQLGGDSGPQRSGGRRPAPDRAQGVAEGEPEHQPARPGLHPRDPALVLLPRIRPGHVPSLPSSRCSGPP